MTIAQSSGKLLPGTDEFSKGAPAMPEMTVAGYRHRSKNQVTSEPFERATAPQTSGMGLRAHATTALKSAGAAGKS